ncbi:MAG: sensor domain-containing protein [Mycobacterium sp.]|uniref:sensor domain-containing protein n=1 Tax=Mycobacterium sp. TaxID=1785 RepID=UPI003CC579F9
MPCKSARRAGATALLLLLVTTGCAIDGTAHPAPNIRPRPLTGDSVKKVLLNADELSKILGQTFKADSDSPDRFGGRDLLFEMRSSPQDCNGVVFELQKSAYGSASVGNVGRATWWEAGGGRGKVISVSETVVALAKPGDADALLANFSSTWKRCNGTTVTDYVAGGERLSTAAISNVQAADSVLSATVNSHSTTTLVRGRAVGARVNCVVEAEVTFFGNHADNSAADVAHRMMDKVSDLS